MKPNFFILLALISSIAGGKLRAQIEDSTYVVIEDSSYFVIKGRIQNAGIDQWELCLTTYFNNDVWQIPVSAGGFFAKRIPVRGIQDVYLYLNDDAITINAFPGDTIECSWDEQDFTNTFKIGSNNPLRNTDLQMNLKLHRAFRKTFTTLTDKLREQKDAPDSVKFSWINSFYNKQLKFILADSRSFTETTAKFITDAYYSCMDLILSNKLHEGFSLKIDPDSVNPGHSEAIANLLAEALDNRMISYTNFNRSSEYRNFLQNYIVYETALPSGQVSAKPIIDDYHRCMANIGGYVIRDWLASKIILKGYEFYAYEDCETAYNDFMGKCRTAIFKDSLVNFHDYIRHFKPGEPAPNFILKDTLDQDISLIDFRGKAVYLDFWGTGCAPCRSDISRFVPQLHEKYKGKDVVFINICVDSDVRTWKKALSGLKLDGINLIAEGWSNNPVCKLYNIHAIPHYIILDRDGKFISYNGSYPWKLIDDTFNELDQAIKE